MEEPQYYMHFLDESEIEDINELPEMNELSIIEQVRQYPPTGWKVLFKETEKALERIDNKLQQKGRFYPEPKSYLFHIFRICPLSHVKVVILGQDPYPDPDDAYGIAFSTPPGGRIRPSLNTIYKELEMEYKDFDRPNDGCLLRWVEQGVFLLNYCLTYHPDNKLKQSEMDIWMQFVSKVIDAICAYNPNAIFVLWGRKAQVVETRIKICKVITGVHPSPIGGQGFLGCGHFREINEHLIETGQIPIDWRLV